MKDRLRLFLQAENITQAAAAEATGQTPATFSHILKGRSNPGYDFLQSLALTYPRLNIEWMLTGVGKMYKDSEAAQILDSQAAVSPVNEAEIPAAEPSKADITLFDDLDDLESEKSTSSPEAEKLEIDLSDLRNNDKFLRKVKVKKIILLYEDNSYQIL